MGAQQEVRLPEGAGKLALMIKDPKIGINAQGEKRSV